MAAAGLPVRWTVGLTVETADPRALAEPLLRELHAFSDSLMKEAYGPFSVHVANHDTVYIFRRQLDASLVGFSFWRHKRLCLPPLSSTTTTKEIIAIQQGKLRILGNYRRLSIHVWATLWYWLRVQWANPTRRLWFISIASLFNYVSMRRSVGEFYLMDGKYDGEPSDLLILQELLDEMIREDNFDVDPQEPARINVKIRIPKSTLAEFPPSFYELSESKDYIKANPNYEDGYDLAYAYPFTFRNVLGMFIRALEQTYFRSRPPALLAELNATKKDKHD